jgi:hypothetical protein
MKVNTNKKERFQSVDLELDIIGSRLHFFIEPVYQIKDSSSNTASI